MMRARKLFAIAVAASMGIATTFAFAQHADPHETPAEAHAEHGPEHGTAEDASHESGHHGPAPINWTDINDKHRPAFIALLVNFGLLLALYYTLGKKPVAEGLKQRRIDIGKDIEDARKMLEEAKARAKKYQGELKNADTDAATAKAALIASGKGEVAHALIEAQERAERMKRDAERLVEQEKKQRQRDLLVETVEIAVTKATELLERTATPEDHARLANDLLAELASKPAATRTVTAIVDDVADARGAA